MAACTGLTVVKRFTYRDNPDEEWSNTYHFRDNPPGDDASWHVLANDLINIEKTVFPASSAVVAVYGYNSDDPHAHAVYHLDLTAPGAGIPGTFVPAAGDHHLAGDQAYMAEWQLSKKNSRGKWIYLRKYLHDGYCSSSDADAPTSAYRAAVDAYAKALSQTAGAFFGGIRARAYTDDVVWAGTGDYITTRTLKRRGKRPLAHV